MICWLLYGLAQGDYPLIISSGVSIITSGAILLALLRRRLPVIFSRMKNRKAAADIALFATSELPPVTEFNKKTRFLHPRRLRKHKRPQ